MKEFIYLTSRGTPSNIGSDTECIMSPENHLYMVFSEDFHTWYASRDKIVSFNEVFEEVKKELPKVTADEVYEAMLSLKEKELTSFGEGDTHQEAINNLYFSN